MSKIEFEFLGLQLLEPMALIMNWLIAVQCLVYFFKHKTVSENEFLKHWRRFFLLFSISTFFGGLSHLLFNYTGLMGKVPGWSLAVIAICTLQLTITYDIKGKVPYWVRPIIYLQLAITSSLLLFDFKFLWVTLHTSIALLFFLGIWSISGSVKGRKELFYFVLGIASVIVSLPFMLLKIDLHEWFNRSDASHVLMMISLHSFYLGAQKSY